MTGAPRFTRPSAHPADAGFMLIGVVLFVIVLTILGLSLFSLSSFESQFLYASNRRADSYYTAASAIERARFVAIADRPLSEVRDNLPPGVLAVAKQGDDFATADSTNPVSWNLAGAPGWVWIRVTADVGGEKTSLEQRFHATHGDSIYERLFTLSGPEGIEVTADDADYPGDRTAQAHLNGLARMTVPVNGGFAGGMYWVPELGPVDAPDLDDYWAAHWAAAAVLPAVTGSFSFTGTYLGGPRGAPNFFRSEGDAGFGWSVNATGSTIVLTVRGTVIWLVETGARFNDRVVVRGEDTDALLVIVARPHAFTPQEPFTGIAFHGGLDSDDTNPCPVVLVTDGRVNLEHDEANSVHWDGVQPYLSVFARNALVMGPLIGNQQLLQHFPGAPEDASGGVVSELVRNGLLPNTTSGGSFNRLDPIAGTWREIP